MKCLLDSMLVLTKQDRLCHVVHATSDPFYQNWLRQLNVVQHCKIITIDDCTRSETRTYFMERILPHIPEPLRPTLSFDVLYEAFGGKLAHWQDYVNEYGEPLPGYLFFCFLIIIYQLMPEEISIVRVRVTWGFIMPNMNQSNRAPPSFKHMPCSTCTSFTRLS